MIIEHKLGKHNIGRYLLMTYLLFISQASGGYTADQWKDEAREYYSSGSYDLSLDAIDNSIKLNDSDPDALLLKAFILGHLNRYTDAISTFSNSLAIDENNEIAWVGMGDAQYMVGNYEDAVDSYDRSIELNRTSADVHYKKGLALREIGRDEEADSAFKQAIRINPSIAYRYSSRVGISDLDLTPYANRYALNLSEVTWDFETGDLRGWNKTGNAFDNQPTYEDNISARSQGIAGQQGNYWIRTYEMDSFHDKNLSPGNIKGYELTGRLISPSFVIKGRKIDFLIGGSNQCTAVLIINDSEVIATEGGNRTTLTRITWNVTPYLNKIAYIDINDSSSDILDYISFDDVRFDIPPIILPERKETYLGGSLNGSMLLIIKPL